MIFKFHFALWCGGLFGVSPYELFQFEKHYFNTTVNDHILLFTMLPLALMIFKPVISMLADHYRAHHHVLLISLISTLIGYGALAAFPFIPNLLTEHKSLAWCLFCFATFIGHTSMGVVNSLADSLAVHAADKKDHHYSKYRLWGPVGFGIFGAIWTLADKLPIAPKYTPGIFLFVLLHSINIIMLAYRYDREELRIPHWHFRHSHHSHDHDSTGDHQQSSSHNSYPGSTKKETTRRKSQSANDIGIKSSRHGDFLYRVEQRVEMELKTRLRFLRELARQEKSIYLYLIAFIFCGILTGFQFQFLFRTLNDLADAHNFESVGTLTALVIIVQAVGGELIFFLFAEPIINKIGTVNTLALSFASFGSRHLIYAFWTPTINSIYLILAIELLQGPAFGLMYCVLTHKAHDYSARVDKIINLEHDPNQQSQWSKKNLLHATLQGILGGSYDGLGLGLGIYVGGKLYDINPRQMWLIAGASALALAMLTLFIRFIRCIYCFIKHRPSAQAQRNLVMT